MKKSDLAFQLRERQKRFQSKLSERMVSDKVVNALTDEKIIESYVKCCKCGEKSIKDGDLDGVIDSVSSAEEFLDYLDKNSSCLN